MTAALGFALFISAVNATAASVEPGIPDPGFGSAGLATLPLSGDGSARDAAIDSRGRILVAGISSQSSHGRYRSGFAVLAFDQSGRRDPSWGSKGSVIEGFPRPGRVKWRAAEADAIATAPNGNVYVAGRVDYASDRFIDEGYKIEGEDGGELSLNRFNFVVRAYNPEGRLLKSFGDRGKLLLRIRTDWSGLDSPAQLLDLGLAPDGSLYVLYEDAEWKYQLVHLDRRGKHVKRFGQGGRVRLDLAKGVDAEQLDGAHLLPERKGVVVAYATSRSIKTTTQALWTATRFSPRGKVDKSFGRNGSFRRLWPLRGKKSGSSLKLDAVRDPAGRIILAGSNSETTGEVTVRRGAVTRLTSSGRLDRSFGSAGTYSPQNADGSPQYVAAVTPSATGTYVLAVAPCLSDETSSCDLAWSTAQLDNVGRPMPSWGTNGRSPIAAQFDEIRKMLAADGHVFISFGETYSDKRSDSKFGIFGLFD